MSVKVFAEDFFSLTQIKDSSVDLVIADPPYGGIVKKKWDMSSEDETCGMYINLMLRLQALCVPQSSAYIFGGIGKPGMRPFFKAIPKIEESTDWKMATLITWSKKRAYGVANNYLFTREEIAFFVLGDPKKPKVFNIPLLEQKRGYAGYNTKYPAKSEYKRRTNVWTDINELFRNKTHVCQKPDRLYQVMIDTSSSPGDTVLDPFAGSGTLGRVGLDRDRILVDTDATYITKYQEDE